MSDDRLSPPLSPTMTQLQHQNPRLPRRPRARIRPCRKSFNYQAALYALSLLILGAQASLRPFRKNFMPRFTRQQTYFLIHNIRGGHDEGNNDVTEEKNAATPRFWSSNSLHRLNEAAMKEAQSDDSSLPVENENNNLPKKKGRHQPRKTDPSRNGRGGALVKTQPPKKSPPRRILRWLVAPPPSQINNNSQKRTVAAKNAKAPSAEDSNNLVTLPKNKSQSTTQPPSESDSSSAYADLAKLWWVNVWTQQLPDRPDDYDENKTIPVQDVEPSYNSQISSRRQQGRGTKEKQEEGPQNYPASRRATEDVRRDINEPTKNKENIMEGKDATVISENVTMLAEPEAITNITSVVTESQNEETPDFISTGYWAAIDGLFSLGLSQVSPAFRISRPLRPIRKATARVTGLHGALSGKPKGAQIPRSFVQEQALGEEDLALVRRRISAINRAREKVAKSGDAELATESKRWWNGNKESLDIPEIQQITTTAAMSDIPSIRKSKEELEEEQGRKERVQEIDKLISEGQKRLMELACEKDELQRRPNPLWNYTTKPASRRVRQSNESTVTTRIFSFPPDDLVEEYLDVLLSSGRLVKLNHTDLWQNDGTEDDDDDEETIGDDLISSSLSEDRRKRNNGNGGSGSWLLRQSLGKGSTLGEKIGEAAEQAAYKSIAKAVMEALAKGISAIHGVNIMSHSDIRLSMEATPDLPPMSKEEIIPGGRNSNYARDALQGAMRRGAKKHGARRHRFKLNDDDFVQRDAVVEMLLSHCQISAPLLKLFPLAWQRAMLGNIVTLVTAVVADFCEGVQFEILGHRLSFSFKPITESDMINHVAMGNARFKRQTAKSDQFEDAVQATANDLSEKLRFLDRWHERALGSGMLRSQLANLIARLVLTLADEVLAGAQMDLWAAQAGGPRMVAGLEYRTTPNYMDPII